MILRNLLCVLVLLPAVHGAGRDNQGYEFILSFMDNLVSGSVNADIELFITTMSNTDANVNITTPLFNSAFVTTAVAQRTLVTKVEISTTIRGSGTGIEDKGVWIQSDQEIIVFGVNKQTFSTDAYQAFPVDVLTNNYYLMTFVDECTAMIVATADGTDVNITLPSPSGGSLSITYNGYTYSNGETIQVTLDKFQTFHMYDSQSICDFTGTRVTSSQPISVVSGNKKVAVPNGSGSSDHLTEAAVPLESLGKKFYTYSTPLRTVGDLIRIMAVEDNTLVTVGSLGSYTINAGNFEELDVPTGTYYYIEADKAVVVGLFSKTDTASDTYGGDPYMAYLIPQPQWTADYTYSTIQTPSNTPFTNQIVVHIDQNKTDGLRLDQANVTGVTWTLIDNNIVLGVIDVSDGSHNIYHIDPTVVFSAVSTGVADFNSYAFASGQRMALINTVCVNTSTVAGDIVDNDCDELIDEETNNGIDDDGDGLIDEDLASPPRVEGNWGSWSAWSNCSVECEGIGNQTRNRSCDNPPAANGGQECPGNSTELMYCDNTLIDCLLDGNWTTWSSWDNCTTSCGPGTQFRDRNCTNPTPKGGGAYCSGAANETQVCFVTACPEGSSDDTALIAGATVGALAAAAAAGACCFLLYPIARRKLRGDEEEEEELPQNEGDAATARDVNLDADAPPSGSAPGGTGMGGGNRIAPA